MLCSLTSATTPVFVINNTSAPIFLFCVEGGWKGGNVGNGKWESVVSPLQPEGNPAPEDSDGDCCSDC